MSICLRRREFIAALGGAAAWPLGARAQQGRAATVGLLFSGSREALVIAPFRKGLSEMGFVEGRNLTIDYRFADDDYDRAPALAAELVRRQVAVIYVLGGDPPISAAKAATNSIPIVFLAGLDPVEAGYVASFNRPGGNVTGIAFLNVALNGKRLQFLHQLVPAALRFALLLNPNDALRRQVSDAQQAAAAIGRQIEIFTATNNDEIDAAFAQMLAWRAEALLIGTSPLFAGRGARQLAGLTLRHALPAINNHREYVDVGGLMSYGSSFNDTQRLAGIYVGRILRGEKPADLPVMQPTRFELVLNLTTAKIIGLDVPPALLALADEVIQ
jgi:putative tryptophan/tyrosine transport system substrate-binding protein